MISARSSKLVSGSSFGQGRPTNNASSSAVSSSNKSARDMATSGYPILVPICSTDSRMTSFPHTILLLAKRMVRVRLRLRKRFRSRGGCCSQFRSGRLAPAAAGAAPAGSGAMSLPVGVCCAA